jgi:small subunit ribosomal protein S15
MSLLHEQCKAVPEKEIMITTQDFRKRSIILNICLYSLIQSLQGLAMPKKKKGKSHSTRPASKRPPSWSTYQPEEVEALVVKLARDGHPPSRIGTVLRDQHAIPLVKPFTGKAITQILKEAELEPSMPEDLGNLLKKATSLTVHIEKNKRDLHNKRALQIVEAKIHKLSRYYKRKGILPQDWRYQAKRVTIV